LKKSIEPIEKSNFCIEVKNLRVSYGRHLVIKGLNLYLPKGELIGILGPNGAGKTTLIHSISGFLKAEGTINIFGKNLKDLSSKERAALISLLPQTIQTPFLFSVIDIVKMGRFIKDEPDEKKREIALKALNRCNIEHFAQRPFLHLSGGERQLVLLARCLCQNSPIFLLDEATSNLDIKRKIQVFEILRQEVERNKRSILIVIHDINLASMYLDRLIFIKDGLVVKSGAVNEVVSERVIKDVFEANAIVIKHPQVQRPAVLFSKPNSSI